MTAAPLPLFDQLVYLDLHHNTVPQHESLHLPDYQHTISFLNCYKGSQGTFNSYRRETERLLHWTWSIRQKTLPELRRDDIEAYLYFCQAPPKQWIGLKKVPRFVDIEGLRQPNPEWRPFVATVSKSEHRKGIRPKIKSFELSQGAIKEIFAILSSYFNYLIQEEYAYMNPVALIRQKSQFLRRHHGPTPIRRLSDTQWETVINTAKIHATQNPGTHERSLFILSALYSMYLRISELAASERWTPLMNHFKRDSEGHWWFTTIGKGNKERQIAVSDAMLEALKRWRLHLGLSALPSPADNYPLLPKQRGKGPMSSTTHIRTIVQNSFDTAIEVLEAQGLNEEAESLLTATVHWLRHTGISDDVKRRPREHVRDDAGHSSSATTDKYIDIEMRERHKTARHKPISQPHELEEE